MSSNFSYWLRQRETSCEEEGFIDKGREKERVIGCESNKNTLYVHVTLCMFIYIYMPKEKKKVHNNIESVSFCV